VLKRERERERERERRREKKARELTHATNAMKIRGDNTALSKQ
jgi:hypothetical protein